MLVIVGGHRVEAVHTPPNWSMDFHRYFKCECGKIVQFVGNLTDAYQAHIEEF